MFKGFKLDSFIFLNNGDYYFRLGNELYRKNKIHVEKALDNFFLNDQSLDGSKIIEHWFPQINAHVFISHSHKDNSLAISLAGWLYDRFKIIAFVDSCIWEHSEKLSTLLDEYSWLDRENRIYDYRKVLYSSTHVHMMLSTALSLMIDRTECLIFLETPNSMESYDKTSKTESPWIYSEIAISQILETKIPSRVNRIVSEQRYSHLDGFEKGLKIKYDLYSKHLTNINFETLNTWKENRLNFSNAEDALDNLYEISLASII